jgi:hypothetical protein
LPQSRADLATHCIYEHALGFFVIKGFLTFGQQLAPQGCADSEVRCLLTSLQSVGGSINHVHPRVEVQSRPVVNAFSLCELVC